MVVSADSTVLRARGCAARCATICAPGGRVCLVISGGRCAGSRLGRGGGCPAASGYPFLDLGEQRDELVLFGRAERGHAVFLDIGQRGADPVDNLAPGGGERGDGAAAVPGVR